MIALLLRLKPLETTIAAAVVVKRGIISFLC